MAVDFDNSGLEIVPYLNEVELSGANITKANRWVLRVRANKRVLQVFDDSTIGSLNAGDVLEWDGTQFVRLAANSAGGYLRINDSGEVVVPVIFGGRNSSDTSHIIKLGQVYHNITNPDDYQESNVEYFFGTGGPNPIRLRGEPGTKYNGQRVEFSGINSSISGTGNQSWLLSMVGSVQGSCSAVLAGHSTHVDGDFSYGFGESCRVRSDYSVVFGKTGDAFIEGSIVHATRGTDINAFGDRDTQQFKFLLTGRAVSTTTAMILMTTAGTPAVPVIRPPDSGSTIMSLRIRAVAVAAFGAFPRPCKHMERRCLLNITSSSMTLSEVETVGTDHAIGSGTEDWDIEINVDSDSGELRVGAFGSFVKYLAEVDALMIGT